MTAFRRWRIFYLVVMQLAQKYTKALGVGFLAGFLLSLVFWQVYPFISQQWLTPVTRIGIVGEFTPNSLPLPIQKEISLGLTTIAPDGSVQGGLAESWEATDSAKTFVFSLKDTLLWHNNKPVEAKDVNYNIKNVTFTVLNARTLKATLNTQFGYSPFPSLLAKPLFQAGLRGFGPYKVTNIRLNGDKVSYLRLVPVDKNKTKKAREYRFYRTEATAILAYKLGEVDEIDDLALPYDLGKWRGTLEPHTNYNRIVSLYFNMNNQLLQDKTLRHALALAVPKIPFERAISPITKTSWAYTDKVKKYDTDLPQAKKLLATAQISSSSATLVIHTFIQYVDMAQTIADSWTGLGVPTNVKVISTIPPDYEVLLSAVEVPPDPDQYPLWHSTQSQTNITGFVNVKIDKLLEDARRELDRDSREKIYADFQRRLVEEAPAVFLYYPSVYSIKRH